MSDWIEQLERLTALHKAGALTDEEFAAQKAKLLAAQDQPAAPPPPPPSPPTKPEPVATVAAPADEDSHPQHYFEEPPAAGGLPKLALFGIPALLVLAGAAWFGSTLIGGGADPELTASPSAAASDSAAAAVATPTAEAPVPVALDGSLKYTSPDRCEAGGALEAIYKKLDTAGELGSGRGMTVKLDAWDEPLAISAKKATDKDGVETRDAGLKFPEATTWHGLKLSRLTSRTTIVPDSDGGYTRTINFLEPADKVQKTLARLGFGAPKAPDYTELEDEGCGGSAQVIDIAGGSALSCSWGC